MGTQNAEGPIFDENGNLVEPKSENEKKYEPMGISLLVQSTQFDLKPSNSEENTYDKEKVKRFFILSENHFLNLDTKTNIILYASS